MFWVSDFYNSSRKFNDDWSPAYYYNDSENSSTLTIEMPGVSRSDLRVDVSDRILTIEAKRNISRGEQKWKGRWMLGDRVNADRIDAHLESGLLNISFPRSEKSKTREIEVR